MTLITVVSLNCDSLRIRRPKLW